MNLNDDAVYYIVKHMDIITAWVFSQTCTSYRCYRPKLKDNPLNLAAKEGYFEIVKWLHQNKCKFNKYTLADAAFSKKLPLVQYLYEHGCEQNRHTIAGAIIGGNLDILKYLVSNNCEMPSPKTLAKVSGSASSIDIVEYIIGNYFNNGYHNLIGMVRMRAAKNGNIKVLEWAKLHGFPFRYCLENAAAGGELNTIKWLLDNTSFILNVHVFANACGSGNLKLVKWLFDEKCPYNELAYINAIFHQCIDILEFLYENNFPFDREKINKVMRRKTIDNLLFNGNNEYNEQNATILIRKKFDLEIVQWVNKKLLHM
ncbi:ankyrin repeat protein [Indivirus ILV1]|uniref:Ankyrin repeat protein n=1 Tax=Indivirus ILV1 TaxID=1977633 RepID=A0A1V0SD37_9VIRU|nr:ankyrin repeat protein [Indivirus ILV1]